MKKTRITAVYGLLIASTKKSGQPARRDDKLIVTSSVLSGFARKANALMVHELRGGGQT